MASDVVTANNEVTELDVGSGRTSLRKKIYNSEFIAMHFGILNKWHLVFAARFLKKTKQMLFKVKIE